MSKKIKDSERVDENAADDEEADDPTNVFWDKTLRETEKTSYPAKKASLKDGRIFLPRQETPVLRECDVLVVGGGIAGWAAATAAARAGAKTILAERDESLGGLWSNGGVLVLLATGYMQGGEFFQTTRGLTDDLTEHMKRMGCAITGRNGSDKMYYPVADPEALKIALETLLSESGAEILYRCQATEAIMDRNALRGMVFETRAGRAAILAKQIVDASGDGIVVHASGAAYKQYIHGVGFTFRLGGFDRFTEQSFENLKAAKIWTGGIEPVSDNRWYPIFGEATDPFDTAAMSRLAMKHRANAWKVVSNTRAVAGCESAHLIWTATQIGARGARTLCGLKSIDRAWAKSGVDEGDTVAWMGADGRSRRGSRVPYGCLVPKKVDNLLVAGRVCSCEINMIDLFRLIAPCLVTGQAAGAAAAVSAAAGVAPRNASIRKIQALLRKQGAYLG
jgi:hypothetical protein